MSATSMLALAAAQLKRKRGRGRPKVFRSLLTGAPIKARHGKRGRPKKVKESRGPGRPVGRVRYPDELVARYRAWLEETIARAKENGTTVTARRVIYEDAFEVYRSRGHSRINAAKYANRRAAAILKLLARRTTHTPE